MPAEEKEQQPSAEEVKKKAGARMWDQHFEREPVEPDVTVPRGSLVCCFYSPSTLHDMAVEQPLPKYLGIHPCMSVCMHVHMYIYIYMPHIYIHTKKYLYIYIYRGLLQHLMVACSPPCSLEA